MVGAERFELPTYWSQTSRATRLRYAPFSSFPESAEISVIRPRNATPFMDLLSFAPEGPKTGRQRCHSTQPGKAGNLIHGWTQINTEGWMIKSLKKAGNLNRE